MTKEQVKAAYYFFLSRAPENERVVIESLGVPLSDRIASFGLSEEFIKINGTTLDLEPLFQELRKLPEATSTFPFYVFVEFTNYCNMSCPFCPSSTLQRKRERLDPK
jgi:hypothetical protein